LCREGLLVKFKQGFSKGIIPVQQCQSVLVFMTTASSLHRVLAFSWRPRLHHVLILVSSWHPRLHCVRILVSSWHPRLHAVRIFVSSWHPRLHRVRIFVSSWHPRLHRVRILVSSWHPHLHRVCIFLSLWGPRLHRVHVFVSSPRPQIPVFMASASSPRPRTCVFMATASSPRPHIFVFKATVSSLHRVFMASAFQMLFQQLPSAWEKKYSNTVVTIWITLQPNLPHRWIAQEENLCQYPSSILLFFHHIFLHDSVYLQHSSVDLINYLDNLIDMTFTYDMIFNEYEFF
jgi:hypothetical protein